MDETKALNTRTDESCDMRRGCLARSSSDNRRKCRCMATESEMEGDANSNHSAILAKHDDPENEDTIMKNTDLMQEHLDAFESLVPDFVDPKYDDYEPLPLSNNPVVSSRHRSNGDFLDVCSPFCVEATASSRTVSRSSSSSTDYKDKSVIQHMMCSPCNSSGPQVGFEATNINAMASSRLETESPITDSGQQVFSAGEAPRPMAEDIACDFIAPEREEGSQTYPDPSIRMGAFNYPTRVDMGMMRGCGRRDSMSAMDYAVRKAYKDLEFSVRRDILLHDAANMMHWQCKSDTMNNDLQCSTAENSGTTDWRSIKNPSLEYIQQFFGINPQSKGQEGKDCRRKSY